MLCLFADYSRLVAICSVEGIAIERENTAKSPNFRHKKTTPSEKDAAFQIDLYVKNIGNEEVNAVNARELWTKLKSKQEFSTWIKARIDKYEFVSGVDFLTIDKVINRAKQTDYFISLDMAKELSMVENNAQGKIARRYFIACEKQSTVKVELNKINNLSCGKRNRDKSKSDAFD